MKANKTLEFRLTAGDLDVYDHLTPYTISNLFQEAASLHAEELNVGYEVMKEKGLAWIVARNKITIYNPINVGKVVKVNTWPLPNGRFDFDREYLLFSEEGNLIAKGTSKWLVYNLKRNFLCSSKGIMEDIDFETKRNYEEKFEKINYGDLNDFNLVYEKHINFSDLDHYGHMNNAKYLVVLMDSLNLNKDELIEEIQVDYINQGYKDHELKVYLKKENNIYYLVGKDLDSIIFVIKAKIKE